MSEQSPPSTILAAFKKENEILRVNVKLAQEQLQKSFKRIKELRKELDECYDRQRHS